MNAARSSSKRDLWAYCRRRPQISCILAMLLCSAVAFGEPAVRGGDHVVGRSYAIGGSWFQYLGRTDGGESLWLYPHVDGVFEVFRETADDSWQGTLGSSFEPSSGDFQNRFHAAEVLGEMLDRGSRSSSRRSAAVLFAAFLELHHDADVPYWAREHLVRMGNLLKESGRREAAEIVRRHREALARVERPGTRIDFLAVDSTSAEGGDERTPASYYSRLVADGYLDISLVGGNLQSGLTGRFLSWGSIESVTTSLEWLGLRRERFREADHLMLTTGVRTILGQPIVVRVVSTGGSLKLPQIRLAVANFVEGLAHADVVIYHGHSNRRSGSYFVSETRSRFSRFMIGKYDAKDLRDKCHGLGQRPYQILALQSCSSFEKYCLPARRFIAAQGGAEPGMIGTPESSLFIEFAPRYAAFFEQLLRAAGPRTLFEHLDAIRPAARTKPLVFRGVLQPRLSFAVPGGVEIQAVAESDSERGRLIVGAGADGKQYFSTGVFAQNRPGEIVQVVPSPKGLYGLFADGRVFFVGGRTGGAMVETVATRRVQRRFLFISPLAPWRGKRELCLLDRDGGAHLLSESAARLRPWRLRLPAAVRLVAIGGDGDRGVVAVDADGQWYKLRRGFSRVHRLAEPPARFEVTPSLSGYGVPGELWIGDG